MMSTVLITQLDEHNEANIIITEKFKPKEIIFLYRKNEDNLMNSISKYYEKNFTNIRLKKISIIEGDINNLLNICNEAKRNNDVIINLTGGSRINSLILFDISKEYSFKSIYLDVLNKKLYNVNESIEVQTITFNDLKLDEIIISTGGVILQDSTDFSNKEDLILLSKYIYKNLSIWHKYKNKLYDGSIFIHNYNSDNILINTITLDKYERELLKNILKKLKEIKSIDYSNIDENKIEVVFKNDYIKSFLFKSGTWLEIITKNLINEIKEIDEVKNGVMFLWNDKSKIVKNELDVIAMKDCIPICISCKDSDKYNEDTLNELAIYSEKIGGENVFKILVATKEPIKNAVKVRAKEMGINIIVFDGDENKFKKNIINIIKSK